MLILVIEELHPEYELVFNTSLWKLLTEVIPIMLSQSFTFIYIYPLVCEKAYMKLPHNTFTICKF